MTKPELLALYAGRKTNFSAGLAEVKVSINMISNGRLVTVIAFVVCLYYALQFPPLLYLLPVLTGFFVMLVRHHGKAYDKRKHLQHLVTINDNEIKALNLDFSSFDPGSEFSDPHHPYSHDLDIFGPGSLYQYINRCNTDTGRQKFAQRLNLPLLAADAIIAHQDAIASLRDEVEFRQGLQASGMEANEKKEDRSQLFAWVKQPPLIYGKKVYRVLLDALPAMTLLMVFGAFFSPWLRAMAVLMVLSQWAVTGFHAREIKRFHDFVSRKANILKKYARLLQVLQRRPFSSTLLHDLQANAKDADKRVGHLASLITAFDARLNSLAMLVVNSLLLYDLQCVYRLEKWKHANASNFQRWLDTVAESEVLCTFATFAFNHEKFPFASITDSFAIEAQGIGHPLIAAPERIANDVSIGRPHRLLIVTGANMAGKSTFLRTLGVNVVLALNGAPVCAEKFACPIIHLRTGMRTADSLKDHQSYFYAELDRLQGIMRELRQDVPLLILLDEILKGTNSTDKQAGSIALLKQLLPHPCLAVIATHDLVLGELEHSHPDRIRNFCFEATIENDQLFFDYKLKPGVAQTMNATFLMKKMGIIAS